jgi:hypothetical protein
MKYLLVVLFSVALASTGWATPIVFTNSAIGSGSLNGQSFSSVAFTVTGLAETTNRVVNGNVTSVQFDSAQISLSGIGTFSFTTPLREFVNAHPNLPIFHLLPAVGLGRAGTGGLDLLQGPASSQLTGWQMLSTIGPLTGDGSIVQWTLTDDPVLTSGGRLIFSDAGVQVTYTATLVPEPSTLLLAIAGFVFFPLRRR